MNFLISENVEDTFSSGPLNMYIFNANIFFLVLQKKSRNELCLRPHDTYCLFIMFFSQVNNRKNFDSGRRSP